MDTKQLIADAKARFKHQENKIYLKEKYTSKLVFTAQGGMWTAGHELISFLNALINVDKAVVQDNFGNPVLVDIATLLEAANQRYISTMQEWYDEHKELAKNR